MGDKNYDLSKGGVKFDQGKPEWTLLPLKGCLEGVVRVLMYGAKKYTPDNWRAGMPFRRVVDATFRHLNAWLEGEDLDPETQLNHIDHALCELLFLRYYITHDLGTDDRFPRSPGEAVGQMQVKDIKEAALRMEDIKRELEQLMADKSKLMTILPAAQVECPGCGAQFQQYANYVVHYKECQKVPF